MFRGHLSFLHLISFFQSWLQKLLPILQSLLSAYGRKQTGGMKDSQSFLSSQTEMSRFLTFVRARSQAAFNSQTVFCEIAKRRPEIISLDPNYAARLLSEFYDVEH